MGSIEHIYISEKDFRNRYQYSTKDLLGEGGFAQVYKAYDRQFQEHVALKFYNKGEQGKYDVLHEMRDSRMFAHKNIIRVYDAIVVKFDQTGTESYVQVGVLEFANGGNFRDFIKTKPSEDQFINVLISILNALDYLHTEKKIIHRDLSPENILMYQENGNWIPKIADFGISKKIAATQSKDYHQSTQLLGKVDYMAPEQFYPEKFGINGRISTNVDLWSFGIILFELFTHEKPFSHSSSDSPMKIIDSITKDPIPDIEDIPNPYKSIIKKCLRKNANKRIKSAKELIQDLTKYQESKNDWGLGSFSKHKRKSTTKYTVIAVISIVVIAILGILGYYLVGWLDDFRLQRHTENLKQMTENKEIENLLTYYDNLPQEIKTNNEIKEYFTQASGIKSIIDSLHRKGNEYYANHQYESALVPYHSIIDNYYPNDQIAQNRLNAINLKMDSIKNESVKLVQQNSMPLERKLNSSEESIKIPEQNAQTSQQESQIVKQQTIEPEPEIIEPESKFYDGNQFSIRRLNDDRNTILDAIEFTETNTIIYLVFLPREQPVHIFPVGSEGAFFIDYNNRQNKLLLKEIRGIQPRTNNRITEKTTVKLFFDKLPEDVKQFNLIQGANQLDESIIYLNYIGINLK